MGLLIQDREHVSNGHRGRLDIIADMLDASSGGVRKTYLMYRCNLSFRQLKRYLDFMVERGLLQMIIQFDGDSNSSLFKVTDKGRRFLKAYKSLMGLMR